MEKYIKCYQCPTEIPLENCFTGDVDPHYEYIMCGECIKREYGENMYKIAKELVLGN